MKSTSRRVVASSELERPADATLLVLATIAKQPNHGHAIQKDIEGGYGTRLGPGALYGAIERLESKGFIAPLATDDRRRPYEITEAGRAFLRAQIAAMRRLTGDTFFQEAPMKPQKSQMPSYYAPEEGEVIESDSLFPALKPQAYSVDELPFHQLGGRRFEILTYLIKQEGANEAVVTLVKSSNDKGRDVLLHRDGKLGVVIQCKNLSNRIGPPDLWDELLKLVLHDLREEFIPDGGIVYELWAPGGLTEPADNIVANWPSSIVETDVKQAFNRAVQRYTSLRSLIWDEVGAQVTKTLSERIRLQRYEGVHLSQMVRGYQQIFARFFECTVVMKHEHVERSFQVQATQISEQVSELVSARIEGDEIDADINEARDLIDDHKYRDAEVLLRRLVSKKQHKLSKNQRFRIVSNLGAVAFGEGRVEEAAAKFLEGVPLEPDDEKARTNEVFAYFLRREFDKTFRLASERRRLYPMSTRLASLWISCAPASTPLEDLIADLDSSLLSNHEVCVALARRCMPLDKMDLANGYADAAILSAPKWSQPWVIRATVAIGYLVASHAGARPIEAEERKEILRRGVEDADKAVELAHNDGPWAKAEALTVRAELFIFSQQIARANADATAALALDAENVNVHLALAQTLFLSGEMDKGISEIQRAYEIEARPDVVLMYARTLAQRASEGDLKRAVEISTAVDMKDLTERMRVAFVFGTLQCIVKTADWRLANAYIDRAEPLVGQAAVKALRASVLHNAGDAEKASSEAADAAAAITSDTDTVVKEFLGDLFMQLGQPAAALPLFKQLFSASLPSFDGRRYVACAARLHLDHEVMEACDVLYQRHGPDWEVIEFEVQYLEKYDKNKAIQRLQEILKLHPDNKLAQVRLSVIGYLHRRPDLIRASMRDLPSVEELPIEYLLPTIGMMRHGEDSDLSIDYAYRYLRLHFDLQQAHEAYIQTVLFRADKNTPPDLEVVAPDAAVLCQELPAGETRWFVLEETDKPSRDFEEISLDSDLARELLGKRKDDKIILAHQSIGNREAVIKQIITKYVRRFQQCGAELGVKFGRSAILQTMQIGPENEVGQPGLVALFNSVQERARQLALAQSWYADQPMSLHVYGHQFNHNAYEGLLHAAQTEGMSIKCTDGVHGTTMNALGALRERPVIFVDLTAVATIRLLGLERIFATQLFQFRMTEATWVELQDTFREDGDRPSGRGGTMSLHGGQYFFVQHDAEAMTKYAEANRAYLESIQQNVDIVSAPELAALDPKTRELLVEYLGDYGAGTAAASAKPSTVLWTDDFPQASLATTTFGANRVWTQIVLLSLTEAGILTQEEYSNAVAKLIGFGFTSTFFDARIMLECAKIADFRTARFPLKQLIDVFQQVNAPGNGLVREFLQFFVLLSQEPALDQYKGIIVQSFLDALWRNPGTHGTVLSLRALSSRLFGLNVVAEATFNQFFDNWRRSLNRPLL